MLQPFLAAALVERVEHLRRFDILADLVELRVVDGNVERVMARLFAVEQALPEAKPELKRLAAALVRDDRPGDWAQALMDLGASICSPRSPSATWMAVCTTSAIVPESDEGEHRPLERSVR